MSKMTEVAGWEVLDIRGNPTVEAITMAAGAGYSAAIAHRAGETRDVTIADVAVTTSTPRIKTGSLSRTDRQAKYNQLIRIENELGDAASLAARSAFRHLAGG